MREVLDRLCDELAEVLGPWREAASPAAFWVQLRSSSDRLVEHLAANPDAVALLRRGDVGVAVGAFDGWLAAMIADGRRVGVIRSDVEPDLLLAATRGVLRAGDDWVLERWTEAGPPPTEDLWALLGSLWARGSEMATRRAGYGEGALGSGERAADELVRG